MKHAVFNICCICLLLAGFGVGIESTADTFFVGQTQELTLTGLTAGTMYIVVYSTTFSNYTFQASGYRYTYKLQIPDLSADSVTLSVYEYSSTTGQNSSSLLTSHVYQVERYADYSFVDSLVDLIPFLFPLVIAGIFVGLFVKLVKRS